MNVNVTVKPIILYINKKKVNFPDWLISQLIDSLSCSVMLSPSLASVIVIGKDDAYKVIAISQHW